MCTSIEMNIEYLLISVSELMNDMLGGVLYLPIGGICKNMTLTMCSDLYSLSTFGLYKIM